MLGVHRDLPSNKHNEFFQSVKEYIVAPQEVSKIFGETCLMLRGCRTAATKRFASHRRTHTAEQKMVVFERASFRRLSFRFEIPRVCPLCALVGNYPENIFNGAVNSQAPAAGDIQRNRSRNS